MVANKAPTSSKDARLDLWLWSVRIYKTRSLATKEIKAGRVLINGVRKKPSATVSIGDNIHVKKPPYDFHLVLDDIIVKRVSAPIALKCYHETEASKAKRKEVAESIKLNNAAILHTKGRPTKKNRREINKLKWNDV